ncbi:MAG: hypothetical protein IJ475_00860 [Bacilli bacterium]|nr:hypothetical protein [Bacilli bacterium]
MDRIKLLNILKQLLTLYFNNEISETNILTTIKENSNIETDINLVPYKETEIVYFLFQKLPYYKIYDELEDFSMILYAFGRTNESIKVITTLLIAYLKDLDFIIQNRINTEINLHIYEMSTYYYLRLYLDENLFSKKISQNSSRVEEMVGMSVAKNINYTQLVLPGIEEEKQNLREDISKHNCTIKLNIEKQLIKGLKNHYDEATYNTLTEEILRIIKLSKTSDFNKTQLLTEQFSKKLTNLRQKIFSNKESKQDIQLQLQI